MEFNRRDALTYLGALFASVPFLSGAAPRPTPSSSPKETALKYKLGKLPARPETVKLRLKDYLQPKTIWTPPADFGHTSLVHDWQMLGNDTVGDCAIAGPFHALMLWNKMADVTINVDTACAVKAYSAITHYDPADPGTDQGSNVQDVAEYWRTTGLTDASGVTHKIDGYVALEPGDIEQLWQAIYLFNGVGIGVAFPKEWMQAFNKGLPWDALPHATIEGGHYILATGRVSGMIQTITWGTTQLLTPAGYEQLSDEAWLYLDEDMLVNGKDIDGFNLAQLKADMQAIAAESS